MTRNIIPLYTALMIVIIIGIDVLFLRNHFWTRLIVNVGIVAVFAAIYLRYMSKR